MLPQVAIGRPNPSVRAKVERYRLLVGDAVIDELTNIARESAQRLYLRVNEESADLLEASYDVTIAHEPQPAGIRHFSRPRGAKWIRRSHIDSSASNQYVRNFFAQYVNHHDAFVFTMPEFLLPWWLDRNRSRGNKNEWLPGTQRGFTKTMRVTA